jgi:hypothetical protein
VPDRDATQDYVEATNRVTGILTRLGAGERVSREEIESARREETIATSRYIGSLVKIAASAMERVMTSDPDLG